MGNQFRVGALRPAAGCDGIENILFAIAFDSTHNFSFEPGIAPGVIYIASASLETEEASRSHLQAKTCRDFLMRRTFRIGKPQRVALRELK
jgi:hypothetical protein